MAKIERSQGPTPFYPNEPRTQQPKGPTTRFASHTTSVDLKKREVTVQKGGDPRITDLSKRKI